MLRVRLSTKYYVFTRLTELGPFPLTVEPFYCSGTWPNPYVDPETNVVYAKTWQEVDIGQKPSLKRKEDEAPVAGQQGAVSVENKTDEDQEVVLALHPILHPLQSFTLTP
ncbi:hypothetical protein FRC15_007322 [Serendipita sp. 397]|nr:hypothetical protein FRC15_007322 [Serendipita sp. 397]